MVYIVHRRFKSKAICGNVNIPALSICYEINGMIMYDSKPLCVVTSENAHQFFARNDDGCGIQRGNLTQRIMKKLSKKDDNHQCRWDKVWNDSICQKYKRPEHADHWLWNHTFFNAEIDDLEHIAKLINA